MNRYMTGSDSAGMSMGYYDTTKLPFYDYLHEKGAPNYVIADHFFQAAFGGSFLNHQYLIAAAAPSIDTPQPVTDHAATSVSIPGFPGKTNPIRSMRARPRRRRQHAPDVWPADDRDGPGLR